MPVPAALLVGTFDLFHVGHLDALLRATRLADRVVVGVAGDDLAERLTGRRPFVPETERRAIVGAIRLAREVRLLEEADLRPLLAELGGPVVTLPGDAVARALAAGLPALPLAAGRATVSPALLTALGTPERRSSVA